MVKKNLQYHRNSVRYDVPFTWRRNPLRNIRRRHQFQ